MNNRAFLRGAIIVLAAITAVIHLTRVPYTGIPFLLNAVGFVVLAVAVVGDFKFLAGRERLVQIALMAYTAITIIAWLAIGDKSLPDGLIGYVTKVVELLLLAAVFVYGRLPAAPRA